MSLVDKRFKGFRDCAIIIIRILRSASCRLIFACSHLTLYYNVFQRLRLEHYLSKLCCEAKSTISEQSDWASSFESSSESLDWSFKSFASLPSISGWVMTSINKTQNATYYSFVPSSTLFSVMLTFMCVMWSNRGVALVCRYSHNFHVFWGWLPLALPFCCKCLYL